MTCMQLGLGLLQYQGNPKKFLQILGLMLKQWLKNGHKFSAGLESIAYLVPKHFLVKSVIDYCQHLLYICTEFCQSSLGWRHHTVIVNILEMLRLCSLSGRWPEPSQASFNELEFQNFSTVEPRNKEVPRELEMFSLWKQEFVIFMLGFYCIHITAKWLRKCVHSDAFYRGSFISGFH